MPAMSRIERAFCQSPVWRPISGRLVGWSSSNQPLGTDVLETGPGSGAMAAELPGKNPSITLGYELTRPPVPSFIHRYDGSPHTLITAGELLEGCTTAGLQRIAVTPVLFGQGIRFVAQR